MNSNIVYFNMNVPCKSPVPPIHFHLSSLSLKKNILLISIELILLNTQLLPNIYCPVIPSSLTTPKPFACKQLSSVLLTENNSATS